MIPALALVASSMMAAPPAADAPRINVGLAGFSLVGLDAAALDSTKRWLKNELKSLNAKLRVVPDSVLVDETCLGSPECVVGFAKKVRCEGVLSISVLRVGPMVELVLEMYDGTTGKRVYDDSQSIMMAEFPESRDSAATLSRALDTLRDVLPMEEIIARAAEAAATEPPAVAVAPRAPGESETGAMPWVVVTAGGVVAVVGVVLVALAQADISTVENAKRGTAWADVQGAYDRAPAMSTAGFVLLGLGAAAAVGGVIWLATVEDGSAQVGVSAAPSALMLVGKF